MKLSARRGLECRFLHHLSQTTTIKGAEQGTTDGVRINLPATFQFSPATSKSIDIPDYIIKLTFCDLHLYLTLLHLIFFNQYLEIKAVCTCTNKHRFIKARYVQ
jgi:hypothetical protein